MGVRKRTAKKAPLKKAAYRSGYEKKVAKHLEDLGFQSRMVLWNSES